MKLKSWRVNGINGKAMAAIISDMGFAWKQAKGFFIIGRVPGLVAHALEQMQSGEGVKRLEESEIECLF